MIRVQPGSRLHFGLLSFPTGDFWPNGTGRPTIPARRFGGVGLMVEDPGVRLKVHPAAQWSAEGPLAGRAVAFAHRFAETLPPEHIVAQHLLIESWPPQHAGLGTGTQLGLAVAQARAQAAARRHPD